MPHGLHELVDFSHLDIPVLQAQHSESYLVSRAEDVVRTLMQVVPDAGLPPPEAK